MHRDIYWIALLLVFINYKYFTTSYDCIAIIIISLNRHMLSVSSMLNPNTWLVQLAHYYI